jgi:hypothetical protein
MSRTYDTIYAAPEGLSYRHKIWELEELYGRQEEKRHVLLVLHFLYTLIFLAPLFFRVYW